MAEFHVHAAADESSLQHGPAPVRTRDAHARWRRAVHRVTPDEHFSAFADPDGIAPVLGLNFQGGIAGHSIQVDTALDFRADDVPVHLVAEVRMRNSARIEAHARPHWWPDYKPISGG